MFAEAPLVSSYSPLQAEYINVANFLQLQINTTPAYSDDVIKRAGSSHYLRPVLPPHTRTLQTVYGICKPCWWLVSDAEFSLPGKRLSTQISLQMEKKSLA